MAELSNKQNVFFDRFQTNEGAYFFRLDRGIRKKDIVDLFKSVQENATEFSLLTRIVRESIIIDSGKTVNCSLIVFKDSFVPDFMKEISKIYPLKEELICYLLVIEIDEF